MNETRLCMTHSYRRCVSFIWDLHMQDKIHPHITSLLECRCWWFRPVTRHGWCCVVWETWCIHMGEMTHSYTRDGSFRHHGWCCAVWGTWLIHMGDMTHSYTRNGSFRHHGWCCAVWERWRIHMGEMTHSYERWLMPHETWRRHDTWHMTWLVHMGDMTHSYGRRGS